ncbi:MAG: 23S rRNA (adenine(2503)-C(2))-methyltransferase RlmN [Polyangiaceae bacterium]|nr:23S rRNA (adenine(2503)-C(2))-methyltransferase RlmN [Polyangiaceae bacterium]
MRPPATLHPVARFPEEWREVVAALGERPYRARQLFKWIHGRGVFDPDAMSDLPRELRVRLSRAGMSAPARVAEVRTSSDGTRKLLVELADAARVECVLIPMTPLAEAVDADAGAAPDDDDDDDGDELSRPGAAGATAPSTRVTLCVSTQHGCAMGCTFCASGRAGLGRGLGAHEIVAQVLLAERHLLPGERLRNLVFMGMGEPLHHYEETARALRLLAHAEGQAMSLRRITVSTVGLVQGIRRLGLDFSGKVGLAVSLHAPDDATRDALVPMNRRFPIAMLLQALRDYPLPRRRRITIEYTLVDGVNDSIEHARRLAHLLRELRVKVNLLPMNPVPGSGFAPSPRERVARFRDELAGAGYSCFVRARRGADVDAACGQLALRGDLVRRG